MHDTTAPWAKASSLLALSFSEILDEEGIDFEEFESRAIAFGHAAIAEAMSLSLERKDASLCAALACSGSLYRWICMCPDRAESAERRTL